LRPSSQPLQKKQLGSLAIVGIEQRKEAAGNDREDDENAWQALTTEALVHNRP
jgi:hypothetical protein